MAPSTNVDILIRNLRQSLPFLKAHYRVECLSVFGSYVRGAQRADSDLDLLVTFLNPPSLLKFIELENYISDLLGVRVDLVMKDSLKPRIRSRVVKEVLTV